MCSPSFCVLDIYSLKMMESYTLAVSCALTKAMWLSSYMGGTYARWNATLEPSGISLPRQGMKMFLKITCSQVDLPSASMWKVHNFPELCGKFSNFLNYLNGPQKLMQVWVFFCPAGIWTLGWLGMPENQHAPSHHSSWFSRIGLKPEEFFLSENSL